MMASATKKPCEAEGQTLELELQRNREAPAIARAAVRGRCQDLDLGGSLQHTLMLLVSEVVSNAVLHSPGPPDALIVLTASVTKRRVRITVTDPGNGFIPRPRDPGCAHAGYGLYLMDKAASRWGVDQAGGTRVWFELARAFSSS
jgi:anti-sigma regulatory factor (Ser/Thr protein kinase)